MGGSIYSFVDVDVENGTVYTYKLESVDMYGSSELYGPVEAAPSSGWSVAEAQAANPAGGGGNGAGRTNTIGMLLTALLFLVGWKGKQMLKREKQT